MTRWARFILTVMRSLFEPGLRIDQESRLAFRVWPTEADLSLMNHASHVTMMEQGRIDFIRPTGFMRFLVRRRCTAVFGSITVQYRARRFQRCELRTRIVCWHDGWFFLEHRLGRRSDIVACGLAKIAILSSSGRLRPADVLTEFGVAVTAPPIAGMIQSLQEGERQMHGHIQDWPTLEWSTER